MDLTSILIIIFGITLEFVIFIFCVHNLLNIEPHIEYEITAFVGDKGSGKTTLACALADLFHRSYESGVRAQFEPIIKQALENGYPNAELPQDTLVYADTTHFSRKSNNKLDEYVKSYDCDFNKFRLPTDNNSKLMDYYPFGACLIFDEVANKAQARQFASFSSNMAVLLNLTRKFGYTIFLMWPELTDADKIIRKSCHTLRVMKGCGPIIDRKGNLSGFKWYFVDYRGPNKFENAQKGVVPVGIWRDFHLYNQTKKEIQKYTYTFYGDISQICDTRPEILYMLNHMTKWSTCKSPEYQISRKDVKDFCKHHPAFSDNLADVADNRTIAEKRKGIYKNKELDNEK